MVSRGICKTTMFTTGMRLILVLVAVQTLVSWASADILPGLPTVPFWPAGSESLQSSELTKIVVDSKYAESRDTEGQTLIPPSLEDFAKTFAEDLNTIGLSLAVEKGPAPEPYSIFLTLGQADEYLDEAGRKTSEGYTFEVYLDGIMISGASPLGAWWGTRTIMQQIVLGKGSLPMGEGIDRPGWPSRGFMVCCFTFLWPSLVDRWSSLTRDVITTLQIFSSRCALSCRFSNRTLSTST